MCVFLFRCFVSEVFCFRGIASSCVNTRNSLVWSELRACGTMLEGGLLRVGPSKLHFVLLVCESFATLELIVNETRVAFACKLSDSSIKIYHLVGLVVKASTSRAEDPGFESRLRQDFSGVKSYQ